ncbi:MAG: hypothetical protein AVDCRST_MAG18-4738 [uncultured Thermomicrobiales bacterium]|uniref:Metallo-beta-lactamase domain-containing protein n=1 Tax=uncultured Thermomicrobiales bacterium TaxID=1645740 RepID=A0A6J4VXW8_9BACT|nr:MAG: hypothetical protein AVDCRST_MAG18-4738 [uncultured Thermomicrobiales bacterium]
MNEAAVDSVRLLPNGGWDPRLLICRCAPTVDSFIVITARYVILIDTLINPATAEALLAIAKPHLRDARTLLVINTHADWDHCWGNQLFAGADAVAPAPILATARCAPRFGAEMAAKLAAQRDADPGRFDLVRPVAPTVLFDERLTIDGGDLTLELFPTPGHTDDHLAMYIPELALLLAGDAAEEPFPFATTVDALPPLRASLGAMMALQPREAFYCHAPERSGPVLLARNIAYFDALEWHCREALARGVASATEDGDELERYVGWRFQEAIGGDRQASVLPQMYHRGHQRHIRLMLDWVQQDNSLSQ